MSASGLELREEPGPLLEPPAEPFLDIAQRLNHEKGEEHGLAAADCRRQVCIRRALEQDLAVRAVQTPGGRRPPAGPWRSAGSPILLSSTLRPSAVEMAFSDMAMKSLSAARPRG